MCIVLHWIVHKFKPPEMLAVITFSRIAVVKLDRFNLIVYNFSM